MTLDELRKLQHKRYREELGHFLIEGEHLVQELQKAALLDPRLGASQLYVTADYAQWRSQFPIHQIKSHQMAQISQTRSPQGIAAVVPLLGAGAPKADQRAIYLYQIQDPGNLGTILRSLAWFGTFRCLLSPDSVDVHNDKVVRASMGALFHVDIETDVTLEAVAARHARIACLDLQGEPISSAGFREFDCYAFGNEARGLPQQWPAQVQRHSFCIAGRGSVESLNVATAVNICQYELHRLA